MKGRSRSALRRVTAVLLVFVIGLGMLFSSVQMTAQAQVQVKPVFTMRQARMLAQANSSKIEQLESKLETKQASLEQAYKTIAMKKHNMSTFRWSPLLSFKFPTKPDLAEAYEFEFKPESIQYEIDKIKHQLTDVVFEIYQNVNTVYLDIVMLEQQIDLNTEKSEQMEKAIRKSEIKLLTGDAKQADIDSMNKQLKTLRAKLNSQKSSLLKKKQKLAKLTGVDDVITKYRFEDPFVEATISTDKKEFLVQYTFDNDQTYYEACVAESSAKMSLNTNYELMYSKYGANNMSLISKYVMQALKGEKINAKAFKADYKKFLKKIDEPWNGSYRIWFIKIPKVWFKGAIDGSRYVEDEPYALYEAALEYESARLEAEGIREEIGTQVQEAFDNYINVRNAYHQSINDLKEEGKALEEKRILNKAGTLNYEEYKTALDSYEERQNEMLEAMQLYSQTLYEFDRLTCGGITKLLDEGGTGTSAGDYGESNFTEETAEGGMYYITSIVQNQEFRIHVSFPENFEVELTHFELWCDDGSGAVQIGERTPIDGSLRHLRLAMNTIEKATLRFYNEDKFIDECEINPDTTSGPLSITKGYTLNEGENLQIGTYISKLNDTTKMLELTLKPEAQEGIAYYLIRNGENGSYLYTQTPISISKSFSYLSVLEENLESVIVELYDADKNLKYQAKFDTEGNALIKNQEEE